MTEHIRSPRHKKSSYDPFLWGDDIIKDLEEYSKWHIEHPQCSTPRQKRGSVEAALAAGTVIQHETDPNLIYAKQNVKFQLNDAYKIPSVGKYGNFAETTKEALAIEHKLRLDKDPNFEDPWWNMSVCDQMSHSHVDDNFSVVTTTLGSVKKLEKVEKKSNLSHREQIKAKKEKEKAEALALALQFGKVPKKVIGPFDRQKEPTRYTRHGTKALSEFTHEKLEFDIKNALEDYYRSVANDAKLNVTSFGGLKRVAELNEMKKKLGGDETLEKMGEEFIKLAMKTRKDAKSNKSMFDGRMDIADACSRGNAVKAIPMLLFGADPNTLNNDDEPILIGVFNKVLLIDANKALGGADDSNDKDRKNLMKILDALVKHGADINTLLGNEKMAPIHLAAAAGNVSLMRWVVSKDCNRELLTPPPTDMTALMIAAKYGNVEVIAELIRGGANFLTRDEKGFTALHYCAMFGQTKTAKFLLHLGAPRDPIDENQKTPAQIALDFGYEVTAQIIIGFAKPTDHSAPVIEYLEKHLHSKTRPNTVKSRLTSAASRLSAFFTPSSNGCLKKLIKFGKKLAVKVGILDEFDLDDDDDEGRPSSAVFPVSGDDSDASLPNAS